MEFWTEVFEFILFDYIRTRLSEEDDDDKEAI